MRRRDKSFGLISYWHARVGASLKALWELMSADNQFIYRMSVAQLDRASIS
jgi:hypothetical protein